MSQKKKLPRVSNKTPNYRSKFEQTIGEYLGDRAEHEPEKIYFIQPSKQRFYIPDFKTKGNVFIECKGKWDASDRIKHVWLREQHPDKRIILVFQNSKVRLNKRSQTTYGDWATKNNLEWYDWKDGIPEEVLNADRNSSGTRGRSSKASSKPKRRSSKVPVGSGVKRSAVKRSKTISNKE